MPDSAPGRLLRRLTLLGLAALAFLPIANWIPGGHSAPWYDNASSLWLLGSLIVVGVGTVLAILSQRVRLLWFAGLADPLIGRWQAAPLGGPLLVALLALPIYLFIALHILGTRPLLIDEIIQTYQGRIFAAGHLWSPQPAWPEFTSSMHLIDWGGKLYGQFPAGGPALAALGTLLGAEWAVGPVAGALSVLFFGLLARRAAPTPGAGLGATLLFALAPFTMFMSGSHMSHVTVLTALLGAALALSIVMAAERARPAVAFLSGLGLGIAATIRPVDALAFALPAAVWYLLSFARDRRRWPDALAAGAGVALPLVILMWVNLQTTGAPLRFGYTVMWGLSQTLGFHAAPNGELHTPIRGLELINLYLLRLQTYLFETPLPSLLPALAALWLVRRTTSLERYLNASALLLIVLYTAYWHDGFFLGPRLMYPLLPVLALWTARAFVIARERWGSRLIWRGVVWGGIVAGGMAALLAVPARGRQYHGGLLTMRWDPDSAAARANVHGALVLVRESWGAQLLARLWAVGITRSEAEALYASVDQCELEHALGWAERGHRTALDLISRLAPAQAERGRLQPSPYSPDPTARYLPDRPYSDLCLTRRREDQEGFTLFPPLLLARGDNSYARDLHARDSLLLAATPDRPVYLLKPAGPDQGQAPAFFLVSRDSLRAAWLTEDRQSAATSP